MEHKYDTRFRGDEGHPKVIIIIIISIIIREYDG